jgi:hypothetical protein
MKITSANGKNCCLIYCGDGKYRIRIYEDAQKGLFKDYEIFHSDLFFNIDDADAFLYEDEENDRMYLDHSPQTLGKNV